MLVVARRMVLGLGVSAVVVLGASTGRAVQQPSGVTIPVLQPSVVTCSDKNVERCLDDSEGNAALLDAQADALIAPELFSPTCSLVFKPISKSGLDHLAFGWYNAKPDPAQPGEFLRPTQAELFGMMVLAQGPTSADVLAGQQAILDLAAETAAGRYDGGAVGFFVAGDSDFSTLALDPTTHALTGTTLARVFYTQHALNPGSTAESTYFQALSWQSVAHANAFYFGWEDRQASAQSDNDFDDLLFLVSGIRCQGSGEACDSETFGICREGTLRCAGSTIQCVPNLEARAETCNGLDDDCNGQVDDGEMPCFSNEVCEHGRCVPPCGTGERRCASGETCSAGGGCVQPACVDVECPLATQCREGACVAACDGVVCPFGRACHDGSCVDPCEGVACQVGETCLDGACRNCACSACADEGCEGQTCAPGTHCVQGDCVDACAGAKCPFDLVCYQGDCVTDPPSSFGGTSSFGGASSFGGSAAGKGGSSGRGSAAGNGGSETGSNGAGAAPGDPTAGGTANGGASKGCGCRVSHSSEGSRLAFGLLALLLLGRRRLEPAARQRR